MVRPEDFNLLIVDDEDVLRESLVKYFSMNDYNIFQASGGLEALEIVKENRIDFMISDIRMPHGDGVMLLQKIREMNPKLPFVIMVTGFSEFTKEDAIKSGALDLLDKPIDMDLLESYIEKIRESM